MINFDALPKDKPEGFDLPEPGFHKATVIKAEVTTSSNGNEYIAARLKLDGGQMVFDNIFNTDSQVVQYKLSRFIQACGIPLTGQLSFQDLASLVVNKEVVVDVKVELKKYKNKAGQEVEKDQAEVDMFSNDIYYPISAYSELIGETPTDNEDSQTGVY